MTAELREGGWRGVGDRLLLIDKLVATYAAILVIVAVTRLDESPWNWGVALGHFLMIPLVWLVRRPGLGKFGKVLGNIYPLLLLTPLYAALDVLQGPTLPAVNDAVVMGWERAIFGGMPSVDWWHAHTSAFLSTLLHGAYWSYYLIVPTPVLWFGFHRDWVAVRRAILIEMGTFLFCYLWFVFFPVAGPYYTFPHPTGLMVQNPMAHLVYATLASGSSYGAAFPSSHVAATTSAVIAAWLGNKRLGAILFLPALLLAIGTVYCQMHYAVDASAGLITGIVMPWVLLKWDHGQSLESRV